MGYCGAATADLLVNILLSQAKLAGKTGITLCFLDLTEISPMQIFYQRDLEDIPIARDAHDDRHLRKPELLGGTPTAVARAALVPSIAWPTHQRLHDYVF